MPGVTVVDAAGAASRHDAQTGLTVRPTVGPHSGLDTLDQAILECAPGLTAGPVDVGEVEQTLFVVDGEGTIEIRGESHPLAPEVGVYLPPGSTFTLRSTGQAPLRIVTVRIIDPSPGPPSPPRVTPLADQALQPATTQREFQVLADRETGLRSATHFVGYIPPERAPDHFHTYDEVIYVLQGEGVMHAEGLSAPVAPGSCIQLPARTVHCLQNTGEEPMRVVAVFRPSGSPASAFYPDGTPAYQATQRSQEEEQE